MIRNLPIVTYQATKKSLAAVRQKVEVVTALAGNLCQLYRNILVCLTFLQVLAPEYPSVSTFGLSADC